ncbi:TnsD family Tn7-like transposition protein [Ralstonia sp. UNC404CL21Col]|uniref:TnsD family Tn7-like transposition protein n=1 Tax=Ralstonia sp. UNC404CL21Col TaxID=1380362 RepID=UPI0009DEB07E
MVPAVEVVEAAYDCFDGRGEQLDAAALLAQAYREPLALCAPPIPGESLISQVGRYHVTSGNLTTRDTYAELFRRLPFQLTAWVPSYVGALGDRFFTRPSQTIQCLLRESTMFPLLEMFTGAEFAARDEQSHIDAVLQGLPKHTAGAFNRTRLCPQCLTENEDRYGTPAILNAHQIPGVSVCFRHGIPLLEQCPTCRCPFERKADLVLTPWRGCSACGRKPTDQQVEGLLADEGDHAIAFARFAAQLLISGLRGASREGIVQLYRAGIHELGVTHRGAVNRKELIRQIVDRYGEKFVKRVDPAFRTDRLSAWLHILIESATWEVHLGRHLLLSFFLYEEAERFLTRYREIALHPRARLTKRLARTEVPDQPPLSGDLIGQVVAASKAIPNCDLDTLWREHYGLMKRLVRQNPGALDDLRKELERGSQRDYKSSGDTTPNSHPNDAFWAKELMQFAPRFYNGAEYPERGTRQLLLRRIGWKHNPTSDLPRFPLLRKELAAACESPWHFYIRRILWALTQPSARAWSRSKVCKISGVEVRKGQVLMDYCALKVVPEVAGPSDVMRILRDWQIGLSWEGPCPERVFSSVGRGYQRRTHGDG